MKITKPTLILNEGVCKANIARMVNKAQSHGLELQPHFKTHQSKAIGEWFRASGVSKITVSSVGMAMYFAENGWQDITIAFPCNILEIEAINDLAQKIELTLLVDNQAIVERLDQELHHSVSIYIEINSGGNRSGVPVNDQELIKQLAELITSTTKLNLKGLYSHAGHTYSANGEEEIVKIGSSSLNQLIELKNELMKYYPQIITCFGDTPSCSVLDDFKGINRISPGNFVFYDVMQTEIGSCKMSDIAVSVACPVVGMKKREYQLVIYGGAVHFSKDYSEKYDFGQVVKYEEEGWSLVKGATLKRLSQEHGIVSFTDNGIDNFKIGDVLGVLPIHSCLTADCLKGYQSNGGEIVDHY